MTTPTSRRDCCRLLYADSERNADMLYACGVIVPDPFLWLRAPGETIVVVSAMEVRRVRESVAEGVFVMSRDEAAARAGLAVKPVPRFADIAAALLKQAECARCVVPADFPLFMGDALRGHGLAVQVEHPFFPKRAVKSSREIDAVRQGVRLAERGLERAMAILREARVRNDGVLMGGDADAEPLTAERLRGEINAEIARFGGTASHTIAAPGRQGADPHCAGNGPIRSNAPIVIDVFPRVDDTGFHGDLTRTVVKGRAPAPVRAAFGAVRRAQEQAIAAVRAGRPVREVHRAAAETIEKAGFSTEVHAAPPHGFIHGTGHGLGLDVHEDPRVSDRDGVLAASNVVTIEPGIYEPEWGGVRLEDVVVVTVGGAENLTSAPIVLEIP